MKKHEKKLKTAIILYVICILFNIIDIIKKYIINFVIIIYPYFYIILNSLQLYTIIIVYFVNPYFFKKKNFFLLKQQFELSIFQHIYTLFF